MKTHTRRATLATITASLLCLFTMLGGPAFARSGGIKGSPQPELKPFTIGPSSAPGSVALEPDGGIVVAYGISSGNGKTEVCVLRRGGHACTHKVTLTPLSGDTNFGTAEVFVPSANHVVVLQDDCCDGSAAGSDLLFTSTDGGATFGAPVRVGTLGVSAAVLIGGNIVFTAGDPHGGAEVQSIPVGATGTVGGPATTISEEASDIGVGSYKGGVLSAEDNLGSDYTTRVAYAASASDFNASSSYHNVGAFSHEQLIGISGNALLTMKTSGSESLELRLFNGTGFGPAHAVPHTRGGGPEWFVIDQDPSGRVHVFSSSTHLSPIYDLFEQSTSAGASWSGPLNLGNATDSNTFAAGLDANGSGLVLGTGDGKAIGYPVLAAQNVTFTIKKASIRKGRATTGSGRGSKAATGRNVELQQERSGRWYTVATTHESGSGSFSFSIKGSKTGTYFYRAVASDLAGYVLYGYSPARKLRVTR